MMHYLYIGLTLALFVWITSPRKGAHPWWIYLGIGLLWPVVMGIVLRRKFQ